MQVNKNLSLNLDTLRRMDDVRDYGETFSSIVESLLKKEISRRLKLAKKGK